MSNVARPTDTEALILDPAKRDNMAAACWALAHRLRVLELAVRGLASSADPASASQEIVAQVGEGAESIALGLSWCRDDLGLVEAGLDGRV